MLRILDDNRETNHLEQEIVVFADYGLSWIECEVMIINHKSSQASNIIVPFQH